jgi:hypothetical protein
VVKLIFPVLGVLLLAGLFHLARIVRGTVEKIDNSVTGCCTQVGASSRDACVESLISVVSGGPGNFVQKNEAVWTLGQLADSRALSALESLRTGIPCSRPCRKDDHICQYELEKAISGCRGEAWLMRALRYGYNSPWYSPRRSS